MWVKANNGCFYSTIKEWIEAGVHGGYKRLVNVDEFGKQERFHKRKTKTSCLLYPKSSEMGSEKLIHIWKTLV